MRWRNDLTVRFTVPRFVSYNTHKRKTARKINLLLGIAL